MSCTTDCEHHFRVNNTFVLVSLYKKKQKNKLLNFGAKLFTGPTKSIKALLLLLLELL